MRLWSVDPHYLDSKGLLANWREGLLALNVIAGKTKGYKHHPQLIRFQAHDKPLEAITSYLHTIVDEAETRGYHFQREKLPVQVKVNQITITSDQLAYETSHLKQKLSLRDPERLQMYADIEVFTPHPLFKVVPGQIEFWSLSNINGC